MFGLKQKCFFCHSSNFSKFQISHQTTDFIRQNLLVSSKNVLKANKIFDFADVICTTSKKELIMWLNRNIKVLGYFSSQKMGN